MYGDLAKLVVRASVEVAISMGPRLIRWAKGLRRIRK